MTGNGGAGNGASERPRCKCHDEPMDKTGRSWQCAVKRRACRRAVYHADPAGANYTRSRMRLRSAIRQKRQKVKELEDHLAEENARGVGEGQGHQGHADADPPEALTGG